MKNAIALSIGLFGVLAFGSPIDGVWVADCLKESQGYSKTKLTLQESQIKVDGGYYDDTRCSRLSALAEIKATSNFEEEVSGEPLRYSLTYQSLMLTIKSSQTATMANLMAICGYSNWKVNVPQDVSGRTCFDTKMPKVGDTNYNIAGLNNEGQLLIGKLTKELDGSTPEKRPVELDHSRPHQKVRPTFWQESE